MSKKIRAADDPPESERDEEEEREDEEDDEEEGESDDAMAEHERVRAAAYDAHTKAAEALEACKGTDSAGALLAAEEAGDEAGEAHAAFKSSSMKLRGAEPDGVAPPAHDAATPAPAPPGAMARALVQAGTPSAEAHLQLLADAKLGAKARKIFGGATVEATEGLMRAALADANDAKTLRTAAAKDAKDARARAEKDADAGLRMKLRAAVRAGKFDRAELFDITEGVSKNGERSEVLTPKAWVRAMSPAALDAMIAAKQARGLGAGGPPMRPEDSGEPITAALRDYCARRGITDDKEIAALAAQMRRNHTAAQEQAR